MGFLRAPLSPFQPWNKLSLRQTPHFGFGLHHTWAYRLAFSNAAFSKILPHSLPQGHLVSSAFPIPFLSWQISQGACRGWGSKDKTFFLNHSCSIYSQLALNRERCDGLLPQRLWVHSHAAFGEWRPDWWVWEGLTLKWQRGFQELSLGCGGTLHSDDTNFIMSVLKLHPSSWNCLLFSPSSLSFSGSSGSQLVSSQ